MKPRNNVFLTIIFLTIIILGLNRALGKSSTGIENAPDILYIKMHGIIQFLFISSCICYNFNIYGLNNINCIIFTKIF